VQLAPTGASAVCHISSCCRPWAAAALQEVRKYEGIVKRQELAALHQDVGALRSEMLRLEDELHKAQVRWGKHVACRAQIGGGGGKWRARRGGTREKRDACCTWVGEAYGMLCACRAID